MASLSPVLRNRNSKVEADRLVMHLTTITCMKYHALRDLCTVICQICTSGIEFAVRFGPSHGEPVPKHRCLEKSAGFP
jgi:hypothetical protein